MADHTLSGALPKYNFSPHTLSLNVPTKLVELSVETISELESEPIMVVPDADLPPEDPDGQEEITLTLDGEVSVKLIPIRPLGEDTTIVGVDSSCIKLGETGTGIIVALRGGVVWRNDSSCRYLRIGPFIFHITEENRTKIYNALRRFCLRLPGKKEAPSLQHMPIKMNRLFELWIKEVACNLFSEAILLFDGSLTAGPDGISRALEELLSLARENSNVVLALSKGSKLRIMGRRLTSLLNDLGGPYLLEPEVDILRRYSNLRFLGRIYVAKLSPLGYPFRLDVDASIPREEGLRAVGILVARDVIYQGYPEVLRLAHIIATFTAPEVMAMQLMLCRAYGLKLIRMPDMRKLLFGPFGTGGRSP